MGKNLPARPHLDHLRRQAKELLAALDRGDAEAVATIQDHLPAARGMTAEQVRGAGLRLADAQAAIARQTGFGSWPQLARHVEQLRSLEGSWSFARLEIDGVVIPASNLTTSCVLIDGDRFRSESPEAVYEGVFNINVEAPLHEIDIEFIAGPEAGNWNYGVYRLEGDELHLCLDLNGKPRPQGFTTSAGSGHASEILKRTSRARPSDVTGGVAAAPVKSTAQPDSAGFEFVDGPTLAQLQGEWTATKIVRDGMELPAMMLRTALRSAIKNEVKILFGGQTMIHALVRIDEAAAPLHIDYLNLGGAYPGAVQLGLMEWRGEEACICMAAPGDPRPEDFECPSASGRTLSMWRRKK